MPARPRVPKPLAYFGTISLLDKPSVAIVGSRKVSDKGKAAAADCARELTRHKINVVSGFADGVDRAAHVGALDANGTTTVVLPYGIDKFPQSFLDEWTDDFVLVVSEWEDNAGWSRDRALARNKTICELSQAVIVVEAKRISGTMNTGRTCLKMGIPLFCVCYEDMEECSPGSIELINAGAGRIMRSRATGQPNLTPLMKSLSPSAIAQQQCQLQLQA